MRRSGVRTSGEIETQGTVPAHLLCDCRLPQQSGLVGSFTVPAWADSWGLYQPMSYSFPKPGLTAWDCSSQRVLSSPKSLPLHLPPQRR